MANMPTFSPNPYGNFDPSQFANPYSQFSGALPWPSSYAGTPTDAQGRPIQSYLDAQNAAPAPAQQPPGLTLNSAPAAPSAIDQANAWALARAASPIGDYSGAGTTFGANNQRMQSALIQQQINANQIMSQQQQQPQQAAPQAAPAGPNMSQAYLQALANPGPVTTPGATVPQSPTAYQPGSGVLQQFLANWRPQASGPGSGFTQGFYNALKGR